MSRQNVEKTTSGLNSDLLNLPTQMLEAALANPQLWREGCAFLAEAADEQAKLLHQLASADSPVAVSAIMTDYWQNGAQRSLEAMTRLMTLTPKSA